MRTVRLLATLAVAVTVLLLPTSSEAQGTMSPPQSENWSGYVASNAYYTGVSALIETPTASAQRALATAAVAAWVGIGGSTSPDLIQAGVEVDTSGPATRYQAWYETLPQASRNTALIIGPGDWVRVDVHELDFDLWQITIVDGQQVFQIQIPYASSHSSAEWIVEDPSAARGLIPLAAVGGANFADLTAISNGQSTRPKQLSPTPIVLVSARGRVEATPSALAADGASFSVGPTL
jgi:hypothetical protein